MGCFETIVSRLRNSHQAPAAQITGADWAGLEGAGVVLICAGVNEEAGGATDRSDPRGRLKLLAQNAPVYRDVVPRIVAAAPDAVLVAVTDPRRGACSVECRS